MSLRRPDRSRDGRQAAPIRIVHLGPGGFFRTHQAWYTEHAGDARDWGIGTFAGQRGDVARSLAAQDGVYTLVVRGADGDRREIISSVSEASTDLADWRDWLARPEVAVITLTITEAGYRRTASGNLDVNDAAVAADIAALRRHPTRADVTTAPGRLVLGLLVRQAQGLRGVAMVPCDNLSANGIVLSEVVLQMAAAVAPGLLAWIEREVAFVSTVVDRISPHTTESDRAALRSGGIDDPVCAVAEPHAEWILAGSFPQGRPRWEDAGARFVDDIVPWEQRKLRLLNGAHTLMAYAGPLRGHVTVAQAIADPVVRSWVEQWWDESQRGLPFEAAVLNEYRSALIDRFSNPRIGHLLAQIAADGSQKIPVRILPTLRASGEHGAVPEGPARVVAAWICHLRGSGGPVNDTAGHELVGLARGEVDAAVDRVLSFLDAPADARSVIASHVRYLEAMALRVSLR